MSTLHTVQLQCNTHVQISNDGGDLSSDAGMTLMVEFLHKIKFDALLKDTVYFNDTRTRIAHDYRDTLTQKLLMNIAGYFHDNAANTLRSDPAFQVLMSDQFVSQPSLSRFFANVSTENLLQLRELLWQIACVYFKHCHQRQFVLDIDSTHSDTYGRQEDATFNAHYMAYGYHPQVVFDHSTGLLLDALLRPGNTYTGKDADQFLERTFNHLAQLRNHAEVIVRGDSGFASPDFYAACDERRYGFIVRLKANKKLGRLADAKVNDTMLDTGDSVSVYHELNYQPTTWKRTYRVIVRSEHKAGELAFWNHTFIVTNLEVTEAERLFPFYQARGNVENDIKELKNGFGFDQTDSSKFVCNAARALISGAAYNLIQVFKQLFVPEDTRMTINGLRLALFHTAGRITRHAHKLIIHLSAQYVYSNWFWLLLTAIQTLEL